MKKLSLLAITLYVSLCQSPKFDKNSIQEAFNTFDVDHDGKVTISELKKQIKFQLVNGDNEDKKTIGPGNDE